MLYCHAKETPKTARLLEEYIVQVAEDLDHLRAAINLAHPPPHALTCGRDVGPHDEPVDPKRNNRPRQRRHEAISIEPKQRNVGKNGRRHSPTYLPVPCLAASMVQGTKGSAGELTQNRGG